MSYLRIFHNHSRFEAFLLFVYKGALHSRVSPETCPLQVLPLLAPRGSLLYYNVAETTYCTYVHLPLSLCSYCARLVQARPETKARALPWLAPAIERAGPVGGADGGGQRGGGGALGGGEPGRQHAAAEGGGVVLVEAGRGRDDNNGQEEGEDAVMLGERGLCRLVQASAAAAAGTAAR